MVVEVACLSPLELETEHFETMKSSAGFHKRLTVFTRVRETRTSPLSSNRSVEEVDAWDFCALYPNRLELVKNVQRP